MTAVFNIHVICDYPWGPQPDPENLPKFRNPNYPGTGTILSPLVEEFSTKCWNEARFNCTGLQEMETKFREAGWVLGTYGRTYCPDHAEHHAEIEA